MAKEILVCGAGAIGIYLGTLLHAKGHNVTLLGRRKLKQIGNIILINNKIYKLPKKVHIIPKNKKYEYIFITTKLYDLKEMIKAIQKNKLTTNNLVSIQNGLVNNHPFEKMLGGQKLIVLSVFEGFRLFENQIIMTPTEMGWKVETTDEGKRISKLLLDAGILCKTEENLDSFRAEKTIVNCCLNALSAIEKEPFDKLFAAKETKKRIDRLFKECYTILKQRYKMEDADIIKNRMYRTWAHMNHYSSTCQDALSGRETEILFLNGFLIELAKKYHLKAPENQQIIKEFNKIYPKSR